MALNQATLVHVFFCRISVPWRLESHSCIHVFSRYSKKVSLWKAPSESPIPFLFTNQLLPQRSPFHIHWTKKSSSFLYLEVKTKARISTSERDNLSRFLLKRFTVCFRVSLKCSNFSFRFPFVNTGGEKVTPFGRNPPTPSYMKYPLPPPPLIQHFVLS